MNAAILLWPAGASLAAFSIFVARRQDRSGPRWAAGACLALGFVLVSAFLALRWADAGRPPFKSWFESTVLFVWCCTAWLLVLRRMGLPRLLEALAGLLSAAALVSALLSADLSIVHLPPSLQSPWFVPHVATYFLAYGILIPAGLAAALDLLRSRSDRSNHVVGAAGDSASSSYEQFMHRAVLMGFPLLTAGLCIGALWAESSWGDYWAWDPKENMALLTWLLFGLYFHLRRLPGWPRSRNSWLVLAGVGSIVFGYLLLNLLPAAESTAHVYQ